MLILDWVIFEQWDVRMWDSLRAHFYISKCKNMHAEASNEHRAKQLGFTLHFVYCQSKATLWFKSLIFLEWYLLSISVTVESETYEKESRLTKSKKKSYLKNAINTKIWQIWLGIQMTKYTNAKKYWRPTVGAGSSSQCSETLLLWM